MDINKAIRRWLITVIVLGVIMIGLIVFTDFLTWGQVGAEMICEQSGITGVSCYSVPDELELSCAEKWKEWDNHTQKYRGFWAQPDCLRPEEPKPKCRWEWKSTLDLAGSSEWEPFSILESDEIEWGPKYGDSRTFSQRGITVKKTRIYLKRQVCEEAK
ncbi:hypothetical protein LCGC14_3073050 [marine sediment metagenome]|uniref:Uncharacterized protein n=1 Tax=marine sediment metagenome TaxID=412755 RepID=A0A0F8WFH7_9ZZZZ